MSSDEQPTLHVVPDAGDPEGKPAEAEVEEIDIDQVRSVFEMLEGQNAALVQRLQILGKSVNPLMLLKIQLDTLIDFTFGEEEARGHFETACSMRLNETLKLTIAQLIGAEVEV